ncbi:hypothetical protein NP233_g11299 [Leucocoprinus birnbaumii]|uniref:Glucose-methanol-choline oxidoreductase C-terminal domain-containing protein n=1 Tax=Leucocoprinus birnbaumii TaxID=56174 RepID=A0AAD5VHC6_9AGAR|nr:hypothetical protein NP233_g11299 [Leucocoprinus birnbaumii]
MTQILKELMKFCRKVAGVDALKGYFAQELNPGPSVSTDEELEGASVLMSISRRLIKEITNQITSGTMPIRPSVSLQKLRFLIIRLIDTEHAGYHLSDGIGSASMLPREKGGVVDTKLRVYGTKNLRVVDLSVFPLHFGSHTQCAAYGLGEIAADIIKGLA